MTRTPLTRGEASVCDRLLAHLPRCQARPGRGPGPASAPPRQPAKEDLMDSTTADTDAVAMATGIADQSLAAEVRATLVLFAMVVLVTLGFALASTLALRLLAS